MFEVWWVIPWSFYCKFTVNFAGETILKSVNIWQGKKADHLTLSVHLGSVLLNDEEYAIDFMYDMQKLLLTVDILVSLLILTLVSTNIIWCWQISTSWLTNTISN